jgi:signal transduction histidine kinase
VVTSAEPVAPDRAQARAWAWFKGLPPSTKDGAFALLLFLISAVKLAIEPRMPLIHYRYEVLTYPLLAVVTLPIALRRRAPVTVLTLSLGGALTATFLAVPFTDLESLANLVALYAVAEQLPMRRALLALPPFALLLFLASREAAPTGVPIWFEWVLNVPTVLAALVIGSVQYRRVRLTKELGLKAKQLESERDRLAHLAVARERRRIASELRSLVARGVKVMAEQAHAARQAMTLRPTEAPASLVGLESTGRAVLLEMQRLLGVLRKVRGDVNPASVPAMGSARDQTGAIRGLWPELRLSPLAVDAAIVVGMGIAMVLDFRAHYWYPGAGFVNVFDPKTALLAGFDVTILLFRRRAPMLVMFAIALDTTLQPPLHAGWLVSEFWCLVIAVYSVGAYRGRKWAMAAVFTSMASYIWSPGVTALVDTFDVIAEGIWFGAAAFAGWSVQAGRQLNRDLNARTAQLEWAQQEVARMAVAEERRRVARDMHDVLGHAVSLIVIQAGAARTVAAVDPVAADSMMAGIERASEDAVREMNAMFGPSGSGDPEGVAGALPGIREIDGLVEAARGAGLDVELRADGEPRALGPSTDLTAYRIAQEALTNVRKHAPHSKALVTLRYSPSTLEVDVTDDGKAVSKADDVLPGAGLGLIGLRERVAVFGGELRSGVVAGGGYRVWARLPMEDPLLPSDLGIEASIGLEPPAP